MGSVKLGRRACQRLLLLRRRSIMSKFTRRGAGILLVRLLLHDGSRWRKRPSLRVGGVAVCRLTHPSSIICVSSVSVLRLLRRWSLMG